MTVYLDTVTAVRLVEANVQTYLSKTALDMIERSDNLLISPMVYFELKGLYRKKRIVNSPSDLLAALLTDARANFCPLPFQDVVNAAMRIEWSRDPGDLIIVGQAAANGNAPLVTPDRNILAHYAAAIW